MGLPDWLRKKAKNGEHPLVVSGDGARSSSMNTWAVVASTVRSLTPMIGDPDVGSSLRTYPADSSTTRALTSPSEALARGGAPEPR
jgi:hypothetical protein